MNPTAISEKSSVPWRARLGALLPWLVILGAFFWALFKVGTTRGEARPAAGDKVIRIGHYQLEPGARRAFDELARDYEKLHPGVKIVQEVIPGAAYGNWLSAQLISGNPVDIVELGGGLPPPVELAYAARYYAPMTAYARVPNPYNKGTPLENVPWFKTYWDEMRWSYSQELQEFTSIPLSQICIRMAVNMDLLQRLTGLTEPPTDFREFIRVCREIRGQKDPQGRSYIAIACSRYHWPHWEGAMSTYLTWPLNLAGDLNYDGFSDTNETFLNFRAGQISLLDPSYAIRLGVARDIAEQCQTGYNGLDRPEAVFSFIQQRAVFMSLGSYEVDGLLEQTKGLFRMKIVDFPRISSADPEYGSRTWGPPIEPSGSLFQFAVVRSSPHADIAIDFLRFLGARDNNEKFNRIIGWLPAIDGAEPSENLKPFKPHVEGMYGAGELYLGGESQVRWTQLYALFQIGQLSFEELMEQYGAFYRGDRARNDFDEQYRNWRRSLPTKERALTGILSLALRAPESERDYLLGRYAGERAGSLRDEMNRAFQSQVLQNATGNKMEPLGRYTPEALEAIRRNSPAASKPASSVP